MLTLKIRELQAQAKQGGKAPEAGKGKEGLLP